MTYLISVGNTNKDYCPNSARRWPVLILITDYRSSFLYLVQLSLRTLSKRVHQNTYLFLY